MRQTVIKLCGILAILALAVCISAPGLAYMGKLSFADYRWWFNLGSLLWFLSSPLWIVPHLFGKKWEEAGRLARFGRRVK
ncbi:MAG: hypothetical protein L0387_09435 [Acidobacteria bacterium]|nr:hypothetical protein [Nitrospiraceae bacterium]MCI0621877.1 hypothetical protein [Acidobacteriota bacterium]MCI0720579.1 hypothetical protein [Acidobacteriota bacterium]